MFFLQYSNFLTSIIFKNLKYNGMSLSTGYLNYFLINMFNIILFLFRSNIGFTQCIIDDLTMNNDVLCWHTALIHVKARLYYVYILLYHTFMNVCLENIRYPDSKVRSHIPIEENNILKVSA